jgi:predicted MFS family arabinose efflux permease
MSNVEVIVPVAFFGMIFGIVVLVTYYRNKRIERTALIASGRDASIFEEEEKNGRMSSLKCGIFLVGIAVGFIIGDLLANRNVMTEEIAYISMVLLFGGISLLLFYFIVRKQGESRQNQ